MTTESQPTTPPSRPQSERDAENWAKPVTRLKVTAVPEGAVAYTVEGRRLTSPVQGFGWLWQKTFRVPLSGASVTPVELIATWKQRFPDFWPRGNRFFEPLAGIAPGEVALLSVATGVPVKLSTGILVLYADDESFTFMTPEGHMLAGWITFSAEREGDVTVAQTQVLVRASDPLYELGMILMMGRVEDRFWRQTMSALARSFGVDAPVESQIVCVDRRWQWSNMGNIRYNAGIRIGLHMLGAPVRLAMRPFRRPRA
jgi:hypothetical protein